MEGTKQSNLQILDSGRANTLMPFNYFNKLNQAPLFTKKQIMKKLYSPVVHFTQNLFSAKSITHLKGLSMAALLLPIMTLLPLAGQGQVEGSISAAGKPIVEMTNVDCTAPVINVVYTTQETDCGARDGSINIQIMDLNASPSTYAINLEHGNKGLTTYSGLMAVGGVLTLSDMATGAYSSISVTRETDD